MQLFYNPELNPQSQRFTFDAIESRHIVKVLRKKVGDILQITNGKGFLFSAVIETTDSKKCDVCILSSKKTRPLRNYYLHVAIAPTHNPSRFEWFLEKATEIGVDEITPLICNHSNHKKLKLERCHSIIHAAAKQSLQFYFPKLNEPVDFTAFVNQPQVNNHQQMIAHCKETQRKPLQQAIQKKTPTILLIGPEGDFSKEEINISTQKGYQPISLGNSRLRTETAGIMAVTTVAFSNQ